MKFNYQARDKQGEVQVGTVEASSREAALNLLQSYGLYVTALETTGTIPVYAKRIKLFERTSRKEIVMFSRQLAIMFKSQVSLTDALRVLAEQAKNLDFKDKILTLIEDVEGGVSFSKALARYPRHFSSLYVAMVKSGEASGRLSDVLDYLAEHLEREYHLYSKIRGALIYPSLIVFIAVAVLVMMIWFVIPNLKKILGTTGQQLPTITKAVMLFADIIKKWGWLLLLAFGGGVVVAVRYQRLPEGRKNFDKLFLKLPLLGRFLKMVYLSRFAENLSTLVAGGLPIARALGVIRDIIGNTVYKEIISQAQEGVKKGMPISSILEKHGQYFPPMFCQMILVGEKTGTLDKTLLNVVSFYRQEVDRAINNLLSILEPVLIVFLGLVVAGLMAAVLLPLYKVMAI